MLLNKEEYHAIKLLLSLKQKNNSSDSFAKQIGLNKSHALKLARRLMQAGLIGSNKGRTGGYYLNKPLSRISVLEVCEAIREDDNQIYVYNNASQNTTMYKQLKHMNNKAKHLLKGTKLNSMK